MQGTEKNIIDITETTERRKGVNKEKKTRVFGRLYDPEFQYNISQI